MTLTKTFLYYVTKTRSDAVHVIFNHFTDYYDITLIKNDKK